MEVVHAKIDLDEFSIYQLISNFDLKTMTILKSVFE